MIVLALLRKAWDRLSGGAQVGVMASGVLVAYVAYIAIEEGALIDPRNDVTFDLYCIFKDCAPPEWEETRFLFEGLTLEARPFKDANKWRSRYNPIRRQYPDVQSCIDGRCGLLRRLCGCKAEMGREFPGEAEAEVCLFRLFARLETVDRVESWAKDLGYGNVWRYNFTNKPDMLTGNGTGLNMEWDMHNPDARYGGKEPWCFGIFGGVQEYRNG